MNPAMKQDKPKRAALPEWALQITRLRERIGINQAELARRLECSAMTISRWERGLLQPSAEYFVQLGNLGNKSEAWFFWEMAGLRPSKMLDTLSASMRSRGSLDSTGFDSTHGNAAAVRARKDDIVRIPLLKAIVGTHGVSGDRHSSLRAIPVAETLGMPPSWCPNPGHTSLLRVKGRSMEPLIRHGDILGVDAFQTERSELFGKIVIAVHEEKGMSVSRLRRYDSLDVLEAENREFDPVVLNKASGWRIVGRVLWWISSAPK
jgi:phage repressor protein C with HTH and peptisase S24 domain